MARRTRRRRSGPKVGFAILGTLLLGILVLGGLATFRTAAAPAVTIEANRPGIGRRTAVNVSVFGAARGLSTLRVELIQGELRKLLAERSHRPRPPWAFWGPQVLEDEIAAEVGSDSVEGLEEGEATIRVEAGRAGTWLLHPDPVVEELTLPVRLVPPRLEVLSTQNYVAQGGSGVVVYRVGPGAVRDGVQAGDWWFPGQPLPERGAEDRFVLYAVPYDRDSAEAIALVAEDDVGNQRSVRFVDRFFKKRMRQARLTISDRFMAKVVPEILAETPELGDRGDLLQNYLAINGELRQSNAAALERLTATSSPRFLWSRPFVPLRSGQVMSSFADRRTYLYEGREVDRQDHLGFDLASTRRAPVAAANSGVVVLAKYFGIYGNTVVIDHGYGLMTLYAHLSSIEVAEGETVERGQGIGRTGQTGLAGGDHLHFSVLVHGRPVNPVEWWDPRWIRDRIAPKLGAALDFEAG
jgi:murein DD-endopeptidase MepM/ murein hydrolase activator NlpD